MTAPSGPPAAVSGALERRRASCAVDPARRATRAGENRPQPLQQRRATADGTCMAISVLDVRSTSVPRRFVVPSRATVRTAAPAAPRRLPLTVLAGAAIGVTEALGLLAVGLTGLDSLLTSAAARTAASSAASCSSSPPGSCSPPAPAPPGHGTGRRSFVAVAYAELFAVAIAGDAAVAIPDPSPARVRCPAVTLQSHPEHAELTVWRSASSMSATPSRRRASACPRASVAPRRRPRPAGCR